MPFVRAGEKLPWSTREGLFRERASPSRHREKRNSSSAGIPRDAQGCSSYKRQPPTPAPAAVAERENEREKGGMKRSRGGQPGTLHHCFPLLRRQSCGERRGEERRHSPLHLLSDNVTTCRGKIHRNHLKLELSNGLSSDLDGFLRPCTMVLHMYTHPFWHQ